MHKEFEDYLRKEIFKNKFRNKIQVGKLVYLCYITMEFGILRMKIFKGKILEIPIKYDKADLIREYNEVFIVSVLDEIKLFI